ncbi:sulfatase-like hydrolase/transferase [Candidatus Fermentibacteria bacterium]|nr:sulfatase-like hydrolase/transferase [Candidatus Fermentibacteria bacterium]
MRIATAISIIVLLLAASCGKRPVGPSIVLVLIDTLRADHLGCYGYHRDTSPTIDSLAAEGVLFERCQSQSSWTLPAMVTILTGLTPRQHGAGARNDRFHGLSYELAYLPEVLSAQGYATTAFFNVVFMNADFGLHRGFDHFDCSGLTDFHSRRTAGQTVDQAISWLADREPGEPFFLAVHFYDPHINYDPPPPFDTLFTDPGYEGPYDNSWGHVPQIMGVNSGEDSIPPEGLRNLVNLYDGEIAYTDRELGRLLAEVRATGGDSTLVTVIADHGEEFLDHGGIEHGHTLYQELLHVPLILCGPGFRGGQTIHTTVAQLDVLPTVLSALGVEAPSASHGVDLSLLSDSSRILPSSGILWGNQKQACVLRGEKKVIWDAAIDVSQAFDLSADAGETDPLPPDESLLQAALDYWSTPPLAEPPAVEMDEAIKTQLRDLGYIR